MNVRPNLIKGISAKDFKEFYWLKSELVAFCKEVGLRTSGGKVDISKRIESYLIGENIDFISEKVIRISKFDWNKEVLSLNTVITDNYKNTDNVRCFFQSQIEDQFKFNVKFMNWMKNNCGKSLGDAILEWSAIKERKNKNLEPKEIAPQFEYNTYLRDFMADNHGARRELGIELWNIKKSLRGSNKYSKDDLDLVSDIEKE